MKTDNDLAQGAGEITPLSEKEIFRRRPHHELARGYVYFISRGDAIKIGFSAKPARRLAHLQNQFTEHLVLLATGSGTLRHERSLHQKFEHLLIGAEWFRPEQDLLDFIDNVKRTGKTVVTRDDELRRTKHDLSVIAKKHKGNVAVVNRVRMVLGHFRLLAKAKGDSEQECRLRKSIEETTESLAQVLRDGGEYIHANHSWEARKARCGV